jgi:cation:H+ antiporter
MKKSRMVVIAAAVVSIVTFFGKAVLVIFASILSVLSSTIGIALLIAFGLSSLLIANKYHKRLRRFITHRAQIRMIALLMLLAAAVWLLILLLPKIHVGIAEVVTTERPVWQATLLFVSSFLLLLKAVDFSVEKATEFAKMVGVSPFMVSFFIVGIVSALPESTIAVLTNLKGDANGAASALLSSNVADLALIFGTIALLLRGMTIKSEALKRDALYLPIFLLPLILMYDGILSRIDGVILLVGGLLFFGVIASQAKLQDMHWPSGGKALWTLFMLIGSLAGMLIAANVAVTTASDAGTGLGVPGVIISVIVVGIGVCLPELMFAVQSAWKKQEGLAAGNVLSVVMIDATIMLGITALVRPMAIDPSFFLLTNIFMGIAALCIIYFARRVRKLGWQEGVVLLSIYALYLYLVLRDNAIF